MLIQGREQRCLEPPAGILNHRLPLLIKCLVGQFYLSELTRIKYFIMLIGVCVYTHVHMLTHKSVMVYGGQSVICSQFENACIPKEWSGHRPGRTISKAQSQALHITSSILRVSCGDASVRTIRFHCSNKTFSHQRSP